MASLLARGVSPSISAVRSSWRVNTSPMPCQSPGSSCSMRRIWASEFLSLGLKPLRKGWKRLRCSAGNLRTAAATSTSVALYQ
ncbi:hypothetical protein D3C72_2171400 [compost metagenome]